MPIKPSRPTFDSPTLYVFFRLGCEAKAQLRGVQ